MIDVSFTLTPAGGIAELVIGGAAFEGWASAGFGDAPSDLAEGGPHLVVELPVERFTPDPAGLVLWIGEDRYRVDLGTPCAPPGGTVDGERPTRSGTLPVMVVVVAGDRQFAGLLVAASDDPASGWDE